MFNNLVKLNVALFNFLKAEVKVKRTLVVRLGVLQKVFGDYFKNLLELYKQFFKEIDPKEIENKKKVAAYLKIQKDLENACKLLDYIERKKLEGKSGIEKRQFYRDFLKEGKVRTELFKELMQEIKQIGKHQVGD